MLSSETLGVLRVDTLTATFGANRFWQVPLPDRFMIANAFFEHLGILRPDMLEPQAASQDF